MALPSGYVQIDYIESTGTQYINTSFTPKGSSRIVMDCELTDVSKTSCFFCARNRASSTDSMSNTSFLINGQYRRDYYGTSKSTTASYAANQRFIVDANKETVTYGSDYTLSFTSTSTSPPMPCILMASAALGTTSGSVSSLANYASMKLYSCQIYDNGILVRDFVPCKTDSGELGLYDNIDSRFYANAGTGTFIAGADVIQDNNKHKTLIDSTGYEIKSGRVLIAGTGYDIKKGRTLIGGTGYDISFGTPVGELPVGTSVFMNVGGVRKEWTVVHQGKPISTPVYYDDTCIGTWLLLKDIYTLIEWAFKNTAEAGGYYLHYEYSKVDKYLRETFFPLLDPHVQALIKQINLPLISRNSATYVTPVTIPRQLFLLSKADLGYGYWYGETFGSLDYFPDQTSATTKKRIAYYNGTATEWHIRDDVATYIKFVNTNGQTASRSDDDAPIYKYGVRPALVLPQEDAKFDDSFNII